MTNLSPALAAQTAENLLKLATYFAQYTGPIIVEPELSYQNDKGEKCPASIVLCVGEKQQARFIKTFESFNSWLAKMDNSALRTHSVDESESGVVRFQLDVSDLTSAPFLLKNLLTKIERRDTLKFITKYTIAGATTAMGNDLRQAGNELIKEAEASEQKEKEEKNGSVNVVQDHRSYASLLPTNSFEVNHSKPLSPKQLGERVKTVGDLTIVGSLGHLGYSEYKRIIQNVAHIEEDQETFLNNVFQQLSGKEDLQYADVEQKKKSQRVR